MLLGGGVKGGEVHGPWPGLADDDLVDGDLAATTDYRNLLAEVLEKRCGASRFATSTASSPESPTTGPTWWIRSRRVRSSLPLPSIRDRSIGSRSPRAR